MTPPPDRCGTSSRRSPARWGSTCVVSPCSPPRTSVTFAPGSTTTCCAAGCCTPTTRSPSFATSPTSTTRSWTSRASRVARSGRSRTPTAAARRQLPRLNVLPPTYEPRATGHVPEMHELIDELIERGHAYPADGRHRRRLLRRAVLPGVRRAVRAEARTTCSPPTTAREPGKRDSARLRALEGRQAGEPADASWPSPWGRGPPGLAHRVLGDGPALPRRRVRHPRRRPRPRRSRTTRTRSPSPGRPGCRSPATGCTTGCSTSARPR